MAIAMASSPVSTSLISGLLAGFTCNMYSLLKSMDKLAISITILMKLYQKDRENLYSVNKLKVGCVSKGVTELCVGHLKPLYKVATFGDQTSGCLLKVG